MDNINRRFFSAPDDSFFIFGPRGTGKSTWIRENLKNAFVINLLDDNTFQKYIAHPGYVKEIVAANKDRYAIFVIDEIQKIPEILDSIHDMIETDKSLRFVLTGSSSRKLKRAGVNLLGGRALLKKMPPFMAAELGSAFNLEHALQFGMVPLIITAQNPRAKLSAYLSLYLKEEVQAEGLVRNIGAFARFLEIISFSHGASLNTSNIARECGVSRKIVDNYISILIDLLLGYLLPVFTKKAQREIVAHPKFYYFDTGVFVNIRPKGPLDKPSEIDGLALEGLVLQHLRAWIDYSDDVTELFYWRTKAGVEVDFVLYGAKHFVAIEVKNTNKVNHKDLQGLKTFMQDYPQAKAILLYRGADRIIRDGILCVPVQEFLCGLRPGDISI